VQTLFNNQRDAEYRELDKVLDGLERKVQSSRKSAVAGTRKAVAGPLAASKKVYEDIQGRDFFNSRQAISVDLMSSRACGSRTPPRAARSAEGRMSCEPPMVRSRVESRKRASVVSASRRRASSECELGSRVRAKVEYSLATARLRVADSLRYVVLIPPSRVQPRAEHLHDVSARLEADVPETATRVVVLYRVGNAFVKASSSGETIAATRRALDSRFDVQVRQSLPFMDFGSARWEMLVAVRNFFHENTRTQSLYDELLVVRPPTRIVGGITMLF